MRATVIQMQSGNDKAQNLEQAQTLIESAVRDDHPDLLMLPEVFVLQGAGREERLANAENLPDGDEGRAGGPAYSLLQELARRHEVIIHGGSLFETAPDEGKVYNTTLVFGRDGNELARYRKIHLFDVTTPDGQEYRESDGIARGEDLVTYRAGDHIIGCTICYDVRFPELYRELAKRGATAIAVPAAFTYATGKDHWETLLRARAIETQSFVMAAAQWGQFKTQKDTRQCWGHAMIIDPWGRVLAQCEDGIGFATADLDLAVLDRVRTGLPSHRHHVLDIESVTQASV